MGEIKTDCKMYKSTSTERGCNGLNKLYCKIEDKPCNFYKQKGKDNRGRKKKK